jgi:hypothetical protein
MPTARARAQQYLADLVDGLIFVKTHHALAVDRGHPTINFSVTAGAVYIVRNPLDVAVSYAHHLAGSIDQAIDLVNTKNAETAVSDKQVYELYGSWSQHALSWTRKPHRAIYVMRYEDMLAEPHKTFGDFSARAVQDSGRTCSRRSRSAHRRRQSRTDAALWLFLPI